MWKEFKAFALKGNVIDLAIGVMIGAAFGKIVSSLVTNVLMPIFGLVLGGRDVSAFQVTYKDAVIEYGVFLQTVIDFFIIAFTIFLVIKAFSKFKRKEEVKPAAPPAPSKEEMLLTEIRDLLKQQRAK